ncbi:hypothetical protein AURDEDRAFT_163712 [Auricularia subglabra TFB-10046 SS5]|nr:hypothetical protein AURDEDRAFT_163712 [Auricularia subglabra TFB-10046 SS5]
MEVPVRMTALDAEGQGHPHLVATNATRVPSVETVLGVRGIMHRETPRGVYAAWAVIGAVYDEHTAIETVESFAQQVLAAEPFFHPQQQAPMGQVVWNILHDLEIAAALIRVCMRTSEGLRILSAYRRQVSDARRRVSGLYEAGLYTDEDSGSLARDIAPARQQQVRGLLAEELIEPLDTVRNALGAMSELILSRADARKRHS